MQHRHAQHGEGETLTAADALVLDGLAKALWWCSHSAAQEKAQLAQEGLAEDAPLVLQPAANMLTSLAQPWAGAGIIVCVVAAGVNCMSSSAPCMCLLQGPEPR